MLEFNMRRNGWLSTMGGGRTVDSRHGDEIEA